LKIESTERLRSALHDAIIEAINCGDFQPGDRLPSESELAENFDVSRNSIRDALASLEQSGVVIRRQGIGTIVTPFSDRLRTRIDLYRGMADLIRGSGYEPDQEFDRIDLITGPSEGHIAFGIDDNEHVVFRRRIFQADNQPAIYIRDYFRYSLIPNIKGIPKISGDTIDYIEKNSNKRIIYMFNEIFAINADHELTEALKIINSDPLLLLKYQFLDESSEPLIFADVFYNTKIIKFNLLRMRDF